MWNWITSFWSTITGVVWPAARGVRLNRTVRWVIHFVLLVSVLVGLYFLNQWLRITPLVNTPWAREYWLPIVFLLFYAILWIGWWVWKLLALDTESSDFPDIDEAWAEALETLTQQGIRFSESPAFLVLGRPESSERNLFESARNNWVVKQAPANVRAPIHVWADRDAVYVTCPGASLLGKLASVLALEELSDGPEATGDSPEEVTGDQTIRPGRKEGRIIDMVRELAGREATLRDKRALRRGSGLPLGPDFLGDPEQVRLLTARLVHVCRLIARERQPYCPINGVLVLVPLAGSDTDQDSQQTAEACKGDMATIRQTTKMDCPIFAMVCDMETLPGFQEFVRLQKPKDLIRRIGQRFPLSSGLPTDSALDRLEESLHFLSGPFLFDSISKFFQIETNDQPDANACFDGNGKLFLLLDEMRQRATRLVRILTQTVYRNNPGPLMFGGSYLAATGSRGQQAFVAGLFNRLSDEQSCVSWTDAALAEDARNHNTARLGYMVLTLFLMGVAVAIAWPWIRKLIS